MARFHVFALIAVSRFFVESAIFKTKEDLGHPDHPFVVTKPLLPALIPLFPENVPFQEFTNCFGGSSASSGREMILDLPEDVSNEILKFDNIGTLARNLETSKTMRLFYAQNVVKVVDTFNPFLRNTTLIQAVIFKFEFFELFSTVYPSLRQVPLLWTDVLALTAFAFYDCLHPDNYKHPIVVRKHKALQTLLVSAKIMSPYTTLLKLESEFDEQNSISTNLVLSLTQWASQESTTKFFYVLDAIYLKESSNEFAFKNSFLSSASACNRLDYVNEMIAKGADINFNDDLIKTPLTLACSNLRFEIARLLLIHGADINAGDLYTPLYAVCENGNMEMLRFVYESGANFNPNEEEIRDIPVYVALRYNNIDTLKFLIEHGAQFDVLQVAKNVTIQDEVPSLDRLILDFGFDIDQQDSAGRTILHLACEHGSLQIVTYIIKDTMCCNDALDNTGTSSLTVAISAYMQNNESPELREIIELLLRYKSIATASDIENLHLLNIQYPSLEEPSDDDSDNDSDNDDNSSNDNDDDDASDVSDLTDTDLLD